MTFDELSKQLLLERFSRPVPEWHPPIGHVLAGAARVRLLELGDNDDVERVA